MKYLLDTHTFIWWDNEPEKLSAQVTAICQESNSQLYVSMVSLWEMQIKIQLGKLQLRQDLHQMVKDQILENDIQLLDISAQHIFQLSSLGDFHKDPFDRLLISQSIHEEMPILSKDGIFVEYPVRVIW